MNNPDFFHEKADRCRLLLAITLKPEVRQQLAIWEREFDELADRLEKRRQRRKRIRLASDTIAVK